MATVGSPVHGEIVAASAVPPLQAVPAGTVTVRYIDIEMMMTCKDNS